MKLTILLDLDDTLLHGVSQYFLPAYLKALGAHLSTRDAGRIIHLVGAAIGEMVNNKNPGRTLEEVFAESFYPALGIKREVLQPEIDRFYEEVHPDLKIHTEFTSEAVSFVETLLHNGHDIVIATNPVFPRTATLQRLSWAGLPADKYPFKLVSTYERFHFCKPSTYYYHELLGQLGWPEQNVVMIGDSIENDIKPTHKLEIPYFQYHLGKSQIADNPWPQGGYTEALAWITEQAQQDYHLTSSRHANIATLYSTPAAILTLVKPLDDKQWNAHPIKGEWCVNELLQHLHEADSQLNIPRVQQIIANSNPFITDLHNTLNPGDHAMPRHEALENYIVARRKLLGILDALSGHEWHKPARHSIFGPVDVDQMVDFMATHDRVHLRQLKSTLDALRSF